MDALAETTSVCVQRSYITSVAICTDGLKEREGEERRRTHWWWWCFFHMLRSESSFTYQILYASQEKICVCVSACTIKLDLLWQSIDPDHTNCIQNRAQLSSSFVSRLFSALSLDTLSFLLLFVFFVCFCLTNPAFHSVRKRPSNLSAVGRPTVDH